MTEIKISELSIGDWVRYIRRRKKNDDYFQVAHIFRGEKGWLVGRKNDDIFGNHSLRLKDIEPIPLTPEILERNGFDAPKAKVWNDSWYWSNRKDVALELRESFGLWYMEIVTKEQRSGLQSNRKLGIGFKSVHQLQHALRLAGVGKEIEV